MHFHQLGTITTGCPSRLQELKNQWFFSNLCCIQFILAADLTSTVSDVGGFEGPLTLAFLKLLFTTLADSCCANLDTLVGCA